MAKFSKPFFKKSIKQIEFIRRYSGPFQGCKLVRKGCYKLIKLGYNKQIFGK